MTSILFSIFAFVFALAILITFHEFGHFIVARALGVKVLRFSIGFGKALWKRTSKAGVEYVVAAVPLGGYVKMLDETEGPVPEDQLHLAFNRKPLATRIAVVVAGPLFNIFFAIFAYWLMFVIGVMTIAPVIGKVQVNSIAANAGLRQGQEFLAINGSDTSSWKSVRLALVSHIGEGNIVDVTMKDRATNAIEEHKLDLKTWQLDAQQPDFIRSLGIEPYLPEIPAVVASVTPGEPAMMAGIQKGDKIVKVDDKAVKDWKQFVSYIRVRPRQLVRVTVERDSKFVTLKLTPRVKRESNHQDIGFIGVRSEPVSWPEDLLRNEQFSIGKAWLPALKETGFIASMSFELLGKLIVGHVPLQSISGPVGIAMGAGKSASIGFAYYLSFLGLVSVSLAIINILPIPILDGGHLLFYLIELFRGRPLSEKTRLISQKIGLFFLLALMALAIYNDVIRILVS